MRRFALVYFGYEEKNFGRTTWRVAVLVQEVVERKFSTVLRSRAMS
jgi:hypothetical protein